MIQTQLFKVSIAYNFNIVQITINILRNYNYLPVWKFCCIIELLLGFTGFLIPIILSVSL